MSEKLLKQKSDNIESAEKYLAKYLKDLQGHFGLDNEELLNILYSSISLLKKYNRPKRWWHFF